MSDEFSSLETGKELITRKGSDLQSSINPNLIEFYDLEPERVPISVGDHLFSQGKEIMFK